jgi:hypothetical protein
VRLCPKLENTTLASAVWPEMAPLEAEVTQPSLQLFRIS